MELRKKLGQVTSLSSAAVNLLILAVTTAVIFIILAGLRSSTSDTNAQNAIDNMTSALNTNLVGNFGIIVIVIVFAVILLLLAVFRQRA